MKYIKISNKGLLEAKLIPLMGGTTKKGDKFKIGQFGTGLKYSLAFLIRNNISFKIFVGNREVDITSKKEYISDQNFDIIYIDGERTSITAQMGYDWNHWMILRELWCNALDEGEAERNILDDDKIKINECHLDSNKTHFFIEYTPDFAKVWQDWTNYFVQDFEPIFSKDKIAVYAGNGPLKLYKQGVLIFAEKEGKSLFNYDFKDAEINELRQYTGYKPGDISEALTSIDDPKIITYFLEHITNDHYEGQDYFDFSTYRKFNDAWKSTIGSAKLIHEKALDEIKTKNPNIDISDILLVPKNIYKALTKCFEGIGALRVINKVNEFYEMHIPELESKIKQGLVILETCGYFVHSELTYIHGAFGDKNIFAQVNLDKKEIYLSERLTNSPLFQIVTMLVEENEHFRTGFQDHTRDFQQHFINLYVKTMLDKNEVKL